MKIESMEFSPRTYNGLKRAGVQTVYQLKRMTDQELLSIWGIGAVSVEEIHLKLKTYTPTNGDRIRAMSDDELAGLLLGFADLDDRIGFCKAHPECEALLNSEDEIPTEWCKACVIKWLRTVEEAEE